MSALRSRISRRGIATPSIPPPTQVTPPIITSANTGNYIAGVQLSLSNGTYTNAVTVNSKHFYYANGHAISGASGDTWTPSNSHINQSVFGRVTVSAAGVTVSFDSNTVGPIQAAAEPGVNDPTLSNPRVSARGDMIVFDISANTASVWSSKKLSVNTAKVSVSCVVPSTNSTTLADMARTITRRSGLRAEFSAAGNTLSVWLAQPIPQNANSINVVFDSGAVNGNSVSMGYFANNNIPNNSQFISYKPKGRLLGYVCGRNDLRYPYVPINQPFYIEAWGFKADGIAAVKFDLTVGANTTTWITNTEQRSTYQDYVIISNTHWTNNSNGGIGVYKTPELYPNNFPEGIGTVTATFYPINGGNTNPRSDTWDIVIDRGSYVERVRYVDSVSGNDANDGLTANTAYANLATACLRAGAVVNGANSFSVPIVKLVGGNTTHPRAYDFYNGSGTGNSIPSATDCWLTVQPAEGHNTETVWVSNYYGGVTGYSPRIRRLRLKNLGIDIADAPAAVNTSISSKSLLGINGSVYPEGNRGAIALDTCRQFHHRGKLYQATEGNSGKLISYGSGRGYYMNHTHANSGQRGYSSPIWHSDTIRNSYFWEVVNDGLKEPAVFVASKVGQNMNAIEIFPVIDIANAQPTVPFSIRGLVSQATGNVVDIIVKSTHANGVSKSANFILESGQNAFDFKRDDVQIHEFIITSGVVGTFQVGENLRNASSTQVGVIREIGTNVLRVSMTTGSAFTAGITVTGVTSGATATIVSRQTQGNIISEGNTFYCTASNYHPDGLQIQTFTPQLIIANTISGTAEVGDRIIVTTSPSVDCAIREIINSTAMIVGGGGWPNTSVSSVTGTFQLGETVRNSTNTAQATLKFANATNMVFAFTLGTSFSSGNTLTGTTSGATCLAGSSSSSAGTDQFGSHIGKNIKTDIGAWTGVLESHQWANNDFNSIFYCSLFENCDGQVLFGENGQEGIVFCNILGVRFDAEAVINSGVSMPGLDMAYVSLVNQSFVFGQRQYSYENVESSFKYCFAKSMGSFISAPGAGASDDGGVPGFDLYKNHVANTSTYSSVSDGMTLGEANWVNGVTTLESYDVSKMDYRPSNTSPLSTVPAGEQLTKYDIYGRERRNDGTGWIGAEEGEAA